MSKGDHIPHPTGNQMIVKSVRIAKAAMGPLDSLTKVMLSTGRSGWCCLNAIFDGALMPKFLGVMSERTTSAFRSPSASR
eukprot:1689796-Amphidinium_carterae.1